MIENYPIIKKIYSRQILDSRGNPTIEVEVDVGHCSGRAAVPSGASIGKFEALELRDNDNKRFHGKEVRKAITNVVDVLQPQLIGKRADQQNTIDQILLETDGTENKSN